MGKMICNRCPLHAEGCRTNCMSGRGAKGGILFLGENPGEEEDKCGKPFVGRAGKILEALLEDAGLNGVAYLTNITRCRGSSIKRKPTIDEIRTCREHLDKELEIVRPKMIVALGQYPAKGMTDNNHASVERLRGSRGLYKGIPVFFTYHPSAVNYDMKKKDYLKEDFAKIAEWWKKGVPAKGKGLHYLIRPWSKLEEDLKVNVCALDIETIGFDPYVEGARIMCISVAPNADTVYYHEFGPQGVAPGSKELVKVLDLLKNFHTFVCHKTTFDMGWLTLGLPVDHWIWKKNWEDTMIALQFKDESYPNTSLAHLAEVYAYTPKLERPSVLKEGFPKGWYTEENRKLLKRYNCRDSIATIRLWKAIHPTLRGDMDEVVDKIKEGRAYSWVSSNLKTVVRMRHSGIKLSQKRLERLNAEMTKKVFTCEEFLRRSGVNFRSTLSVRKHLFEKLKLPVLKRTDKTQEPALDREVLQQLEEMDKTGWVKRFSERKKCLKIRDTYCKNMRAWGEIAHPEVFIARAADDEGGSGGSNTGRVTCKGFINLPRDDEVKKGEITVKKCLTSRYGAEGVIVALDYSQMEMRILANEANDERMKRAFLKGLDLHTYTAAQVAGCKMSQVDKIMRQRAKAVNFGIVYGQTAFGLSKSTGMKVHEAEAFIQRYLSRFEGVEAYIKRNYEMAEELKVIHSPIGRVFHLPNARWIPTKSGKIPSHDMRKAVNSPIQSAANDFCTEAIRQVLKFIDNGGYEAHVILTVYDSIVMDWKKDHLAASELMMPDMLKEVFETQPKKAMRELGWNIDVPIEFEVKSGPSLGECK